MISVPDNLRVAAQWLKSANRIVIFTGAGVSVESGVPTFRDSDGFWQRFPPDEFATWRGIRQTALRKPRRLAEFVGEVLGPIGAAKPNAAHVAIADLESLSRVTVLTQNVDGLHQAAGSTVVREIHGNLMEVVTRRGRFVRLLSKRDIAAQVVALRRAERGWFPLARTLLALRPIAGLGIRGIHRPNVILFGEGLAQPAWNHAQSDAAQADLIISIGTSGMVYPAALLPEMVAEHGGRRILIDPAGGDADLVLRGTACHVVPMLVKAAFGSPN